LKTTSLHAAEKGELLSAPYKASSLEEYQRILTHSVKLRSHLEVLVWLQGDMQRYLPHDIMIASWGNFLAGDVKNDIISIVNGVRSVHANGSILTPILMQLFAIWQERDKTAFVYSDVDRSPQLEPENGTFTISDALRGMRFAMVHGIKDERGSHDCLYLALSSRENYTQNSCSTFTTVLPYIDYALRQVEHLPHQSRVPFPKGASAPSDGNLVEREVEILRWIAMGKTNSEIGSILEISVYTVKNHVQKIFRKLNVSNRAQAVAVLKNNA
jgi:transcriptional regulator EpsA